MNIDKKRLICKDLTLFLRDGKGCYVDITSNLDEMIKYYTNRELSERLGHNLAKWKRWSREYLPPDPLGGMQSGYARQYMPDEAFAVHLGGHLVADLHFAIPDARQVLQDLQAWRSENGFSFSAAITLDTARNREVEPSRHYLIYIAPNRQFRSTRPPFRDAAERSTDFQYLIRGILSTSPLAGSAEGVLEERFVEAWLPESLSRAPVLTEMHPVTLLNITALLKSFVGRLDIEPASYAALQ